MKKVKYFKVINEQKLDSRFNHHYRNTTNKVSIPKQEYVFAELSFLNQHFPIIFLYHFLLIVQRLSKPPLYQTLSPETMQMPLVRWVIIEKSTSGGGW